MSNDARTHIPGIRFPIQGGHVTGEFSKRAGVEVHRIEPGWVPWTVAEVAYKAYCDAGHGGQSLETLAERGGFGWFELMAGLRGSFSPEEIGKVTDMTVDAVHRLRERAWRKAQT